MLLYLKYIRAVERKHSVSTFSTVLMTSYLYFPKAIFNVSSFPMSIGRTRNGAHLFGSSVDSTFV